MLSTSNLRQVWAPACNAANCVTIPLYGEGRVTMDRRTVAAVNALNEQLRAHSYETRRNDTGAYNCRKITGGSGYSLHAYGIAMDLNWQSNPYGRQLVTDMPPAMVNAIKAIRTNNGKQVWRWGGDYANNKDAMHYEVVCTPADLATGIKGGVVTPPKPEPEPTPKPKPKPEPPEDDDDMPKLFCAKPEDEPGAIYAYNSTNWTRNKINQKVADELLMCGQSAGPVGQISADHHRQYTTVNP
jgi:hypothetical protein